MAHLKRYCFWFLMTAIIAANTHAQTLPVSSQLQLTPPYSVFFSDLLRPETDQVKLNLLLRDLQEPFVDVKLKLKVEGPGISLETAPWYNAPAITLESGIPQLLTSVELAPYFDAANLNFGGISRSKYEQQGGRLPEGLYRISFTVIDAVTSRQLSQPGRAIAWMALSEPPRLNLPFCDTEINLDNGQQYIVFQWSPVGVSPNTYGELEYEFTLTEIRPAGRDPYEAMRTLPPVYQFTTSETSLVYDNDEPLLIPGMAYAWRIQAKDINGKERFREQGFSPVCMFRVAEIALPPAMGVRAEAITSFQGRAYWDLNEEVEDYRVEYRSVNGATWYGVNEPEQAGGPIDGELNISGLAPGKEYEVRVGSRRDGLVSSWSESVYFTTPEEEILACGDVPPSVPMEEFEPLPNASVGDVIAAGDVNLTLVSFSGSNGVYSGWGTVKVNFLGNRIPVEFKDIKINKNYRMVEGSLYSVQSNIDAYIKDWRENQDDATDSTNNDGGGTNAGDSTNTEGGTSDYVDYDGEIDSVYVNGNGEIVVVDEDGGTETFDPSEGDGGTTFVDGSGDSWTVDENGDVQSGGNSADNIGDGLELDLQQKLIVEVLDEFKADIDNWLETHGKGPLDEWEIAKLLELPSCLPEDEEELEYFRDEAIPEVENSITDFLSAVLSNDSDREVMNKLVQGLNSSVSVKSQLDDENWQKARETTCRHLVKGFGRLYFMVGDEKYRNGDLAVVKREYKKSIDVALFKGKEQVVSGLVWEINDEVNSLEKINFDLSAVSKDAEGTEIVASWNERSISIKVVIAEIVLARSITMAVSANLYPIVEPEGIANRITFQSSNERVLNVKTGYPVLKLNAGEPGEATITAKIGDVVYSQKNIKVIKEPTIDYASPVVSNVKFDNVPPTSINYTFIKLTELESGGLNGLCSPEKVLISEPQFYYLKGDKWYPFIEHVSGEYFFDYRLITGQEEVTGPEGNTTEDNHCSQVLILNSIPKYNHSEDYQNYINRQVESGNPIWYMKEAVKKHEEVHEPKIVDSYRYDIKDSLLFLLHNELVIEDQPQKSFSELENDNIFLVDLTLEYIGKQAAEMWKRKAAKRAEHDHDLDGPAEKAEYSVLTPMVEQICNYSQMHMWNKCSPNACDKPMEYGPEIPYIVDVTDPNNNISYNLNEYVNISMGNREEIRLRFQLKNSMIIDKDLSWKFNFNGWEGAGTTEIIFKKEQLMDTPEIIYVSYQSTQFNFNIKR